MAIFAHAEISLPSTVERFSNAQGSLVLGVISGIKPSLKEFGMSIDTYNKVLENFKSKFAILRQSA